ncbi:MAG: helix-hairpin-helix domain-containing protein [Flavobacteriales bacterium]|nr:helix-hairpin-helix domain-containing protein [Flavobacteriales bacterium]MDP4731323.1 helix-hairpin-helix domain-containing protein [Flavobacteriales bacterium]MDP4818768.1 helix-hairpin-helix domain-containing protein [Flavobacteriales bacterium]MDP4951312.1 helix-hairpin-helix domain-containing protein [Flavobacteriales bacterium]
MNNQVLSRDQRVSILIWISLAAFYLTYKEIAAFYYPTSSIVFQYAPPVTVNADSSIVNPQEYFTKEKITSIEINSADSNDLIKLKIPSYLISKILLYRDQLGGYASSFQLLEIYHFPENIFERIHPLLKVNIDLIQPLGINSKSEEEMTLHPYLSYKEAKALALYRKNNGLIQNQEEFDKIIAIATETKDRLKPYLAKDFQSYANTTGKSP